jgi:hypothetical protein
MGVQGKFFSRRGRRLRLRGVTYGPFAPNSAGQPFPKLQRVVDDFNRMRLAGVNSVRTYHVPPEWLLDLADEYEVGVFLDLPWPKHLCFLDSRELLGHVIQLGQIEDWAFGITRADRAPKMSCAALEKVFRVASAALLARTPRVSVVVCSYNGGKTLEQCLRSLQALDYPDYEVIVVDDGSTDDTGEILARFPEVRAVRQSNQGLSFARNVGLRLATGEVVAYTDSDCYADPDWLTLLVDQLERTGAAAVDGPNLSPEDGCWPVAWRRHRVSRPTCWSATRSPNTFPAATSPSAARYWK